MSEGDLFEELVSIVTYLRAPNGCPWDRKQTHASLLPYFLEEAYEVIETVEQGDWATLSEELGDILLHIVFQANIAEGDGEFTLRETIRGINDKLIRRHSHVFGSRKADGDLGAKLNWEAEKQKEKGRESRLDGVPKTLPALVRAQRLQEKASYVGFDWKEADQVWQKVHEELKELKHAERKGVKRHIDEELGDLLFALVNLCRFLDVPAEDALRRANDKFTQRFHLVEKALRKRGKSIEEATLEQMDAMWNQVKKNQDKRVEDQEQ